MQSDASQMFCISQDIRWFHAVNTEPELRDALAYLLRTCVATDSGATHSSVVGIEVDVRMDPKRGCPVLSHDPLFSSTVSSGTTHSTLEQFFNTIAISGWFRRKTAITTTTTNTTAATTVSPAALIVKLDFKEPEAAWYFQAMVKASADSHESTREGSSSKCVSAEIMKTLRGWAAFHALCESLIVKEVERGGPPGMMVWWNADVVLAGTEEHPSSSASEGASSGNVCGTYACAQKIVDVSLDERIDLIVNTLHALQPYARGVGLSLGWQFMSPSSSSSQRSQERNGDPLKCLMRYTTADGARMIQFTKQLQRALVEKAVHDASSCIPVALITFAILWEALFATRELLEVLLRRRCNDSDIADAAVSRALSSITPEALTRCEEEGKRVAADVVGTARQILFPGVSESQQQQHSSPDCFECFVTFWKTIKRRSGAASSSASSAAGAAVAGDVRGDDVARALFPFCTIDE